MCDLCNYDSNNINNAVLNVCYQCYNTKTNMITKTDAMKKYVMTSNDMSNVRHYSYVNQYKKNTYLYLVRDIEYIATQKYGSVENMNDIINKKADKIKKKYEDKQKKIQNMISEQDKRKVLLNKHLMGIGFGPIRNDSKLCWNYIYNGEDSGHTIESIGKTLLEMKFLHEYTTYPQDLKNSRQQELKDCNKQYYYWTDEEEEQLRHKVKLDSVKQYVVKNFKVFDQMIEIVPKSIQPLAQKYYAELVKLG